MTLEKIRRYASAPNGEGGDAWKFTPIFDFDHESGFWKSVILPEVKQERQRHDILNLVAARDKADRQRRTGERYGGWDERPNGIEEKPKGMYPTGPNLSAIGRKMGFPHKPLGKRGKVLCYNFSAHSGCAKGGQCLFSQLQRIRPEGLHWTAKYDLARRGGLVSGKRIGPNDVEGFSQALRAQISDEVKKSIDESRGNVGRKPVPGRVFMKSPPRFSSVTVEGTPSSTVCAEPTQQRSEAKFEWEGAEKGNACAQNNVWRKVNETERQVINAPWRGIKSRAEGRRCDSEREKEVEGRLGPISEVG